MGRTSHSAPNQSPGVREEAFAAYPTQRLSPSSSDPHGSRLYQPYGPPIVEDPGFEAVVNENQTESTDAQYKRRKG
jgi:hypothetical protein